MARVLLLIEDNPSDEKLTVRAFRRSGIANEIVVVRDGAEALDWLFATGKHAGRDPASVPALVLLDLKLPRIDGLEVLRRARADERTRFIPIVILTASKEEEDLVRSYSLGANAYVRKPVDFREFVEAARTIEQFWLVLNNLAPSQRRS